MDEKDHQPIYHTMYLIAANGEREVSWNSDGSFVWVDGYTSFTRDHYYHLLGCGFRFGFRPYDYRMVMFHPYFTRGNAALLREIGEINRRRGGDTDKRTMARYYITTLCMDEAFKRRQNGRKHLDEPEDRIMWFDKMVDKHLETALHDLLERQLFNDMEIDPNTPLVDLDADTISTFWAPQTVPSL